MLQARNAHQFLNILSKHTAGSLPRKRGIVVYLHLWGLHMVIIVHCQIVSFCHPRHH